jgi:monoterpene epsilon-lactone hydrolase
VRSGETLQPVEESAQVIAFPGTDGVEVRHLRAFIAVAEELNFSRAAERLYLSQPALSRQVRMLERVIGCELLRRSPHRVELTLAGQALLDRARPVLESLEEAVAAAQAVGGELNARIMSLWAPMSALADPETSIAQMREEFEAILAHSPMPPDVSVRPVIAGGTPALELGGDPAILYLHGGGYILGSAYGYRPLAGALVAATGTAALVPDFRLAPEHPFPAALDDALAAYRWLVQQRGEPGQIVLAGDSSGAGLALALMLRLKAEGERLPAAAVLLCPAVEISGAMLTPAGNPHPMDAIWSASARSYLAGHPADDPLVSPLHGDLRGLPPLLIQCSTGDRVRPEAEALATRATQLGVEARLETYTADTHVFQVYWSFLPEARDALAAAGGFIGERLGLGRPDQASSFGHT